MKSGLLAIAAIAVVGAAEPSRPTRGDAHVRLAELAVEVVHFREDTGVLPSSLDGLVDIAPQRLLADPWGHDVYYLRVAGGFWLMSWGADGAPGGDEDAADIVHIAR